MSVNQENSNAKIVSFMNMKGGVGKTTVCVNLAHCLAVNKNKKVLVIDLDPQSNTSQYILGKNDYKGILENKKTIFSIYELSIQLINYSSVYSESEVENNKIEDINIIKEISSNFHLIPGDLQMVRISQGVSPNIILNLHNYIKKYNLLEKYDYIFIDCPPTQSIYTDTALMVSDYYILPVKPDFLSTIGIDLVKRIIKNSVATSAKKIKCAGIILNMVHSNEYEKKMIEEIKKNNISDVFSEYLKYSSNISKGSENQQFLLNTRGNKGKIIKISEQFLNKTKGE